MLSHAGLHALHHDEDGNDDPDRDIGIRPLQVLYLILFFSLCCGIKAAIVLCRMHFHPEGSRLHYKLIYTQAIEFVLRNYDDVKLMIQTTLFFFLAMFCSPRVVGFFLGIYLRGLLSTPKGGFLMNFGWISLRLGIDLNEIVISDYRWDNPPKFQHTPFFLKVGQLTLRFSMMSIIDAISRGESIRIHALEIDGLEVHIERGKKKTGLNLWACLGAENEEQQKKAQEGVKSGMASAAEGVGSALQSVGSAVANYNPFTLAINAVKDRRKKSSQPKAAGGDGGEEGGGEGEEEDAEQEDVEDDSDAIDEMLEDNEVDDEEEVEEDEIADGFVRHRKGSTASRNSSPRGTNEENVGGSVKSFTSSSSKSPTSSSSKKHQQMASGGGSSKSGSSSKMLSESAKIKAEEKKAAAAKEAAEKAAAAEAEKNKPKEWTKEDWDNWHWGIPFKFECDRFTARHLVFYVQDYLSAQHVPNSKPIEIPIMEMDRRELTTRGDKKKGQKNRQGVHLDTLVWKIVDRLVKDLLASNSFSLLSTVAASGFNQAETGIISAGASVAKGVTDSLYSYNPKELVYKATSGIGWLFSSSNSITRSPSVCELNITTVRIKIVSVKKVLYTGPPMLKTFCVKVKKAPSSPPPPYQNKPFPRSVKKSQKKLEVLLFVSTSVPSRSSSLLLSFSYLPSNPYIYILM